MSCLCSGNCFRRELPAGVVDGVGRIEDQLTDGHNGIPVVDQAVEDGRQGLRRVQRSVVEQHDAPRLHLGCYAPAYRIRVVVLPVQGVPIGNDLKPLCCKGLQVWQPDFLLKEYSSPLETAALPLKNYKRFPAEMAENRFFYGSRR